MSKYLKLFETTSQYEAYISGSDVVLPNVSVAKDDLTKVYYKPYVPPRMDIITYTASAKLAETTDTSASGLHTNAFNTTIKSHTFENGVGTIEFNGDVTSIGESAFDSCAGLTSITIPDSVTSIGNNAFYNCTGLTSITIPDSVTSIGEHAFNNCSSLTNITIPDSVTSIGDQAFFICLSLTSVTSLSITPPTLIPVYDEDQGKYIYNHFSVNASGRKIYVPSESVAAYKSASGWSTYASDIEAIPSV